MHTVLLRSMVEKSWAWAKQRGLVRVNEVHGEEEAKLLLEDWFENDQEKGTSTTANASGEFEDTCKCAIKHIYIYTYVCTYCGPSIFSQRTPMVSCWMQRISLETVRPFPVSPRP